MEDDSEESHADNSDIIEKNAGSVVLNGKYINEDVELGNIIESELKKEYVETFNSEMGQRWVYHNLIDD